MGRILEIRRYEQERDNVVLYFTGLTDEKVCASFNLVESQKVENRSASTVNIFDYYKPESRASLVSVCSAYVCAVLHFCLNYSYMN